MMGLLHVYLNWASMAGMLMLVLMLMLPPPPKVIDVQQYSRTSFTFCMISVS